VNGVGAAPRSLAKAMLDECLGVWLPTSRNLDVVVVLYDGGVQMLKLGTGDLDVKMLELGTGDVYLMM
jgi:hypothetical protein